MQLREIHAQQNSGEDERMKSGIYKYDLMATKRNDPDYEQVSGYVHKEIALKFRIFCMTERLTQSDALEQALSFWIESKNSETNQPSITPDHTDAPPPDPQPTEPEPRAAKPATAAKAKRGKASKGAS
jgi:hypothetical protein